MLDENSAAIREELARKKIEEKKKAEMMAKLEFQREEAKIAKHRKKGVKIVLDDIE